DGIPTIVDFFGTRLAKEIVAEHGQADLVIANNVMAHVPDLNDFVEGMATLVAPTGLITVENPAVGELIERCEFDTVYHEHYCYFSSLAVDRLMRSHGLSLNHVDHFPDLHGGTDRWSVGREVAPDRTVEEDLAAERAAGLDTAAAYESFAGRVRSVQDELRRLLRQLKDEGKSIAAYGAAAKGATLLNSTGIGRDLVDFVVDRNTHKQGHLVPGSLLPILPPEALLERRPDYVVLLAWNLAKEIVAQQDAYLQTGGRFIVPVPWPQIV
ncbi:MAG TPA: class I SAM-dependent methyltransferase, partial [Acidimicrobiales bacterium]